MRNGLRIVRRRRLLPLLSRNQVLRSEERKRKSKQKA
jgi:hypothetical protein